MDNKIDHVALKLNDIFKSAGINFLRAVPTKLGTDDALRIVYAGVSLADPQADLKGEDSRKLASAFIKAGVPTSEYMKLLEGKNEPALYMEAYTPPLDMLWTVVRGYINPWTMYVIRPDAAFFDQKAKALAKEMGVRFKTNALVHA